MASVPLACPNPGCGQTADAGDLFCRNCGLALDRVLAHRRIAWFIRLVHSYTNGLWLSLVLMVVGYLLTLSLVGLPFARRVFQSIPQAFFLDQALVPYDSRAAADGLPALTPAVSPQRPWPLRAVWLLLIGLWLLPLWHLVAWMFGVTLVGRPISRWMFLRAWVVATRWRR